MIVYKGTPSFQVDATDDEIIVETALMRNVRDTTLQTHRRSGRFVSWAGAQGNGKTATAGWLKALSENGLLGGVDYRIAHYRAGSIQPGRTAYRDGIRSLTSVVDTLSQHALDKWQDTKLGRYFVHALQAENIQMIIVDDVDGLCEDAIEGMAFVLDTAKIEGWKLTLVLVGVGGLATGLLGNGRLQRRMPQWCYFEPYSLEEILGLLAGLDPHFANLDMAVPDHREQVAFIHERFRGLPGAIVPFLDRVQQLRDEMDAKIDKDTLWAAYYPTHLDRQKTTSSAAKGGYPHLIAYNETVKEQRAESAEEQATDAQPSTTHPRAQPDGSRKRGTTSRKRGQEGKRRDGAA